MGTGYEQAPFRLDMGERPKNSDIHVRLPLAHTLSKRTAGPGSVTGPLTVSDLIRSVVLALLNERTDIHEQDKHELAELSRQLRRIGANLNQLAYAYNAALLDRPLHYVIVVEIEGHSYRLREHANLVPDTLKAHPLQTAEKSKRKPGRPRQRSAKGSESCFYVFICKWGIFDRY